MYRNTEPGTLHKYTKQHRSEFSLLFPHTIAFDIYGLCTFLNDFLKDIFSPLRAAIILRTARNTREMFALNKFNIMVISGQSVCVTASVY